MRWPRGPAANGSMKDDGGGRGCEERKEVGEVRLASELVIVVVAEDDGSATSVSRSKMPAVEEERWRFVHAAGPSSRSAYMQAYSEISGQLTSVCSSTEGQLAMNICFLVVCRLDWLARGARREG